MAVSTHSDDAVATTARASGTALRRVGRIVACALVTLTLLCAAVGFWSWTRLRASLPAVDGQVILAGLGAPVAVERDAFGVPTIRGGSRDDVARATGFVHAQDRFFQMDLLRRRAAGELSELVGPAALPLDRRTRVHRLRHVAEQVLAAAPARQRAVLQAYADGVNAGLAALRERPFEYLLLRATPAPWRPEDSLMVALTMFIELNGDDDGYESALGVLHDTLPPRLADFLSPVGTEWDAPLVGGPILTPPVPAPDVFDIRHASKATGNAPLHVGDRPTGNSNAFAVAGSRTAHGGAILANDMHLNLSVPNIWYRASLAWDDLGTPHRVTGVTLPGTPVVSAGSNGRVAWGFTNSYGDWQDLVVLDLDPTDADRYLTPSGPRRFEHPVETIRVKGGADERVTLAWTIWGPVIGRDHRGRWRALRWTAHDPDAINLNLAGLERATTLEEALDVANRSGIPPQNFVCVDDRGHIGWTIAGLIPRRVGFDGRLPGSWANGSRRWEGWRAPRAAPRVVDPPDGQIWTANARVVGGEALSIVGDGGYWLGARARQIRDDLRGRQRLSERDLLQVQLDDRALLLERWQKLLVDVLARPAATGARRVEARRLVAGWGARAAIDSAGYRIVRSFRLAVLDRVLAPLAAACSRPDGLFDGTYLTQAEGPVWRIVEERPAHLLDPAYSSWDELLIRAADVALAELGPGDLAAHTWGEANTAQIHHPISRALPLLGPFLDMPHSPLPGDEHMPRFQAPGAGASERLVVSPGREADGIFEMPGGQSGHPLSPFYRAGHGAWARGEPTPFLPGRTIHTLTLEPAGLVPRPPPTRAAVKE
jgi:penicillin amidase